MIAAIDGVCIGGALEFAASCDLRIGTHRSRYATPEVRIGLGASNAGTLLLPEVLGESATRELLLTGQLKTAGWMNRHGFFNDVVDDLDAGIRDWITVFDLTTRPAVHRTKRMLNERFGDLLPEAMARETQTCVDLFPTPRGARGGPALRQPQEGLGMSLMRSGAGAPRPWPPCSSPIPPASIRPSSASAWRAASAPPATSTGTRPARPGTSPSTSAPPP